MNRVVHVEVDEDRRLACSCAPELAIHPGDQCVVEAEKILEFGKVSKIEESGGNPSDKRVIRVLRRATLQDLARANEDGIMSRIAMNSLISKVEKLGLNMRVVRARYSFDRAVLRVTFTAEERVDYSLLVQDLSAELRTRIEMNQIGVRDEARMIGGMGPCGRRMCCCARQHRFESVNVRMAKAQKISLNPGAISGMCSRLKCCLRYEFDTYRELSRNLPYDGAFVQGPDGKGRVIDKDILRQRVKVRLEDDRIMDYDAKDLQVDQQSKRQSRDEDEDSGAEWTESDVAGKVQAEHEP